MLRKLLALAIISSSLAACASWYSSSSGSASDRDNPAVGSKDGSDFLFSQSASAPVASAPVAKPATASDAI